jgi:Ni,Fe-hydrogenase maturation factor
LPIKSSRWKSSKASVLLLGIGSILMGNEGVGVHFINWMQNTPGLEGRDFF